MIERVIFINEQYLKDNTNLSGNIDIDILKPAIVKAQDMYISDFLGKEIDTELKFAYKNNTLSLIQEQLLFLVRNAQVEFTAYIAYIDVLYRWTNKSATTQSSENSQTISTADLLFVRDQAKVQGDFYLNKVKCFISDNKTAYPSFYNFFECNCNGSKDTNTDGIVYADFNLKYTNNWSGNFPDEGNRWY